MSIKGIVCWVRGKHDWSDHKRECCRICGITHFRYFIGR